MFTFPATAIRTARVLGNLSPQEFKPRNDTPCSPIRVPLNLRVSNPDRADAEVVVESPVSDAVTPCTSVVRWTVNFDQCSIIRNVDIRCVAIFPARRMEMSLVPVLYSLTAQDFGKDFVCSCHVTYLAMISARHFGRQGREKLYCGL